MARNHVAHVPRQQPISILLDVEQRDAGACQGLGGERKARDTEGRVYQQIEVEHGRFHREIQLGVDVDAGSARAKYEDGILRIELPVADPGETRNVPISTASSGAEDDQ